MNYKQSLNLNTKQIAIFKIALIALGIIIGIHWGNFLNRIEIVFWVIFLSCGWYIFKTWLKQSKS